MTDIAHHSGTFPRGHHAYLQREANARLIARLSPEDAPHPHASSSFEFPDPTDLRGIPVCGPNVTGTIRGTQPENAATR